MVVRRNNPKKFVGVKNHKKFCNPIANVFFYHYTLILVKIYGNVVDVMTILSIIRQKIFLTKIGPEISFEKLFQQLLTYYTTFKHNKMVSSLYNDLWLSIYIHLL